MVVRKLKLVCSPGHFIRQLRRPETTAMFLLGVLTTASYFLLINKEAGKYCFGGHRIQIPILTGQTDLASTNHTRYATSANRSLVNTILSGVKFHIQLKTRSYCPIISKTHHWTSLISLIQDRNSRTFISDHLTFKTGYDLAQVVRNRCGQQKIMKPDRKLKRSSFSKVSTYSNKEGNVKLCPVWKVGTTFFKRLFAMNTMSKYKNAVSPFDISFLVKYDAKPSRIHTSDTLKTFMFVRDPYHRLSSVYVDKLLAPNPVYWKILGVPAIRLARRNADKKSLSCGHDLTFREYVKYVAATLTSHKAKTDIHFESYVSLCKPCEINYNFIGKLESLQVDSAEMLKALNLNNLIEVLASNGSELVADDAIRDTTYQPFDPTFVPGLKRCLERVDVFKRSWKKLKLRGLIGDQNLTLAGDVANDLTYDTFLDMARNARRKSTRGERSRLKERLFLEMYSSVDKTDMDIISRVYAEDFRLFNYESRPDALFRPDNHTLP